MYQVIPSQNHQRFGTTLFEQKFPLLDQHTARIWYWGPIYRVQRVTHPTILVASSPTRKLIPGCPKQQVLAENTKKSDHFLMLYSEEAVVGRYLSGE